MSLNGKVALVTGGATGIGFAIAHELAEQGATVIISGRRQQQLDEAAAKIGDKASAIAADVGKLADLDALFEKIKADHGRLDIFVANAGFGEVEALGSLTEEYFDRVFATNVKGTAFSVQNALPLMEGGGSIVIVGSTASINPGPGLSAYGATKGAVRTMVRSWIHDIKGSGIRINIVSPGPVNTDSLRGMLGDGAQEILDVLADKSTIGRIGEPIEIARAVAFLASDASSYINGAELFADGGASQG
jgi:NAD(P)-dependent dehydrogenase (short-subunit alcohol dehydrogenase family)